MIGPRESITKAGAYQYIDYRKENYWKTLSDIDYVIDTIGAREFEHELSILKRGGRLLSLRTGPNKAFAVRNHFSRLKEILFALVGAKYDRKAEKEGKEYHFIFVRSDGEQLRKITKIVEENNIIPKIDPHMFTIEDADEALRLVADGYADGKVLIRFS